MPQSLIAFFIFLLIAAPAGANPIVVLSGSSDDDPVDMFSKDIPAKALKSLKTFKLELPDLPRQTITPLWGETVRDKLSGPDIIRPDPCIDLAMVKPVEGDDWPMPIAGFDKAVNDLLKSEERACSLMRLSGAEGSAFSLLSEVELKRLLEDRTLRFAPFAAPLLLPPDEPTE